MWKKGIRVGLFLVILAGFIYGLFQVIRWKDTAGEYVSSVSMLYNTEDNLVDVVFVGSSHCYCGINPALLWENYGMAAFDMSISAQDKDSAYHSVKELLKTQKPKVVFVDLLCMTYDRHQVQANVYRNMLSMNLSRNSYELVRDYGPDEGWEDYVLRWPILHTRYRELKREDFIPNEVNSYGRGQNVVFHIGPGARPATCDTDKREPLNEKNKAWLDNLYQLSQDYGFELGFMVIPYYFEGNQQEIYNSAKDYASERGIPFVDMNTTNINLDYNTDFSDMEHVNYLGAAKVTNYIGDYIVNNYNLEDRRGDDRYYQWDLDEKYYEQRISESLLNSTSYEDESFWSNIQNGEDYFVVLTLNGEYQPWEDRIYAALSYLNISKEDMDMGGKWVFKGGELIYRMPKDSEEIWYYEINDKDTLLLQNNTTDVFSDVMFNKKPYTTIYNGLGIYVYDTFLKKVIVAFGCN